jgi:hypothetical protein
MTELEKETIRAVIVALRKPRNRFGKIESSQGCMSEHARRLQIPRGGSDSADQAQMILTALIGDTPKSILD